MVTQLGGVAAGEVLSDNAEVLVFTLTSDRAATVKPG
jgi:hypothetical protein